MKFGYAAGAPVNIYMDAHGRMQGLEHVKNGFHAGNFLTSHMQYSPCSYDKQTDQYICPSQEYHQDIKFYCLMHPHANICQE